MDSAAPQSTPRLSRALLLSLFATVVFSAPVATAEPLLDVLRRSHDPVTLDLNLETDTVSLGLQRFDIFTESTQFVDQTADGPVAMDRPDVPLWRGRLADGSQSVAFVSVVDDTVVGFVRRNGAVFELRGDGRGQLEAVAPGTPRADPGCDFDLAKDQLQLVRQEIPETPMGQDLVTLDVEVAIDADKNLYDFLGSTGAASAYITSLFGAVSTIYQNDVDVILTIPYLRVWSTSDPYSSSSSSTALSQFRSYWISNMGGVQRDVAHLVSRAGFGGIAYLGVLCSNSYGYGVSGINATYNYPNSNYTWDADVVSHELGHNFGSPHTHCYNPVIDRCYNQESGCYSGSVVAQVGTVMSYCHLVAGKNLTFHSRVQTVVRAGADNASCVDPAGSCGTISLSPSSLPGATVGQAYSQGISASGGSAPYTYSVISGSLPAGLSLSSGGSISGTPSVAGTSNFTIRATDSSGCTGSRAYSLTVSCGAISISPASLPNGVPGQAYSQTLSASGGAAPYTYSVISGALPSGLSLSSGGALTGTPTTLGTSNFTVRATGSTGCTGSRAYSLTITCAGITLSPSSLPSGSRGTPYSATISATGGQPPYTFARTAGALPPGLTLSAGGSLTGTPTQDGNYSFTVTATGAAGCQGSRAYTVVISSSCSAITLTPTTLPDGVWSQAYSQTISASGGTPPYTFSVSSGTIPAGLSLSAQGALTGTPSDRETATFDVTATDASGCTGLRSYTVEVRARDQIVAGMGLGQPSVNRVRGFDNTQTVAADFLAYGAGSWGCRVATGEVDGVLPDAILTGPGPGDVFGPQLRAFQPDGTPRSKINFYAYGTLKFGVNPDGSDSEGDGYAELFTGPGPGAVFGPHFRGWNFDGATLVAMSRINFFAYGTLRYGVNVEGGDVDGDRRDEHLTAPGPGAIFGPQIRGWNSDGGGITAMARVNFNAFSTTSFGAELAGGSVDDDTFAEIVTSPAPVRDSRRSSAASTWTEEPSRGSRASTRPSTRPATAGGSVWGISPSTSRRTSWRRRAVTPPRQAGSKPGDGTARRSMPQASPLPRSPLGRMGRRLQEEPSATDPDLEASGAHWPLLPSRACPSPSPLPARSH